MRRPSPATGTPHVPGSPVGSPLRYVLQAVSAACWAFLVLFLTLVGHVLVGGLLGWTPVVVTSGSMAPAVPSGSLVLSEAPDRGELLQPGALVTFRSDVHEGVLVTHRVVGVRPDGTYETRGDANPTPDSTRVGPADVVGVARLVVPVLGTPVVWLHEGRWWLTGGWLVSFLAAAQLALSPAGRWDGDEPSAPAAPAAPPVPRGLLPVTG